MMGTRAILGLCLTFVVMLGTGCATMILGEAATPPPESRETTYLRFMQTGLEGIRPATTVYVNDAHALRLFTCRRQPQPPHTMEDICLSFGPGDERETLTRRTRVTDAEEPMSAPTLLVLPRRVAGRKRPDPQALEADGYRELQVHSMHLRRLEEYSRQPPPAADGIFHNVCWPDNGRLVAFAYDYLDPETMEHRRDCYVLRPEKETRRQLARGSRRLLFVFLPVTIAYDIVTLPLWLPFVSMLVWSQGA